MNSANILVVEDEAIVAQDVRRQLESMGYRVPAVLARGEDAIRAAGEIRPELVLMDIRLEGDVDGVEAAGEIRRRFRIPVVYMTAFTDEQTLDRAKPTEPLGYLVKPVDRQNLRTAVEMSLHRHDVERELQESHEWLQTTLRSIGDAVIATDREGNVSFLNPVAEDLISVDRSKAIGQPMSGLFDLISERTGQPRPDPVAQVLSRGVAVEPSDHVLVRHHGGRRTIRDSASPIFSDDGQVLGAVFVFHDVTAQRREEAQRRDLEARVQHIQKLESLFVLAGGVAHDFNNLLTVIMGNADLALMDADLSEETRQSLLEIRRASSRASELGSQMLAYSGKGRFVIQSVDLSKMIADMEKLLRLAIPSRARLQLDLDPTVPPVSADIHQIRQLLMNLATNAGEAIGEDDGTVTISVRTAEIARKDLSDLAYVDDAVTDGKYACIEIRDDGEGMDEEVHSRMFDPFFTTKFAGRGLGLAAALGIVRGHRGVIGAHSTPGEGTVFQVLLPFAEAHESDDRDRPHPPRKNWRTSGKVLVVDDEAALRRFCANVLTRLGLEVIQARHGKEALEIFADQAGQIRAVLLDMTMPVMDGKQTLPRLLEIDPEARVILCSGYTEEDTLQNVRGMHVAGFIQKPFTFQALAGKLQQVLEPGTPGC